MRKKISYMLCCIIIVFIMTGCGQRAQISRNLLLGSWQGKFAKEEIQLTFHKNDSLEVLYINEKRRINRKYKLDGDMLILSNVHVDTAYITTLNISNLALRPKKDEQEAQDLLFMIEFKRVDQYSVNRLYTSHFSSPYRTILYTPY